MLRIFFQITIFPLVFEISAETKRLDFCNRFLFITIEIFISPGSHKLLVVILRRMTTNFKNFPGIFLNMNNIVSSISQLFWSNVMSSFWVHISLQVLLCNCRNRHVSLTSREYLCTKLFLFLTVKIFMDMVWIWLPIRQFCLFTKPLSQLNRMLQWKWKTKLRLWHSIYTVKMKNWI